MGNVQWKAAWSDHITMAQICLIVFLCSFTSLLVKRPNIYSFKALVVPTPSKPDVVYTSIDFDPALPIVVIGIASPCIDNGTYFIFHPGADFIGCSNNLGSCLGLHSGPKVIQLAWCVLLIVFSVVQ